MSIKRSNTTNGTPDSPASRENEAPKFRENAEINSKIDAYIQKNPKEWAYIQSMPRERLDRSLVLQAVQKQERGNKMRDTILKKLDENPEMKEALKTLVKNLPAEKQEQALASLAARTMRTIAPAREQQAQAARI